MERRELLKMIALLTGSALIGGEMFLTGCTNEDAKIGGVNFSEDDIAFMDEIGETILPKTNTPGAKDAEVGKFMQTMVNDCYDAADQKTFHDGLAQLNEASKKAYNTSFVKASPEQRKELLTQLDKEARAYQKEKSEFDKTENENDKAAREAGKMTYTKKRKQAHYFTMMKQLTLLGFFTSKPGSTQALRLLPVPGKFDGAYPYKKGDRAWAE